MDTGFSYIPNRPYNTYNQYNNLYKHRNWEYFRPYNSIVAPPEAPINFNDDILKDKKKYTSRNNFANFNFDNILSGNSDEPIIEIFDIKLYLDDIIILGLLFFLYTEGVKDEMLFLSLLLLLIG